MSNYSYDIDTDKVKNNNTNELYEFNKMYKIDEDKIIFKKYIKKDLTIKIHTIYKNKYNYKNNEKIGSKCNIYERIKKCTTEQLRQIQEFMSNNKI